MQKDSIEKLYRLIAGSSRIVFFGGAGVSTESGIPDFRSKDGLYNQEYDFPPETILSHTFFLNRPEDFFRFYRNKILSPLKKAAPNPAHRFLAYLEKQGKLKAVVTQNIDGLHQAAGSQTVYELHGSVLRNACTRCRKKYPVEKMMEEPIPVCTCSGIVKPDVVLYEEPLDADVTEGAVRAIAGADLLLIGGTSLAVYPAAGLIRYYRGRDLVLLNRDPTPADDSATLLIRDPIGTVFGELMAMFEKEARNGTVLP